MPFSSYMMIGLMLFALFFGAGNLIFPAELGQAAGTNVTLATIGFLITGVGLPFLGILAIGFSGNDGLQQLAGKIHPLYGIIFTATLYLTIGPFFAAPRTGAVAFDMAMKPFLSESQVLIGSIVFTLLFFGGTLLLSLNPSKIVDRIGKYLSPAIIILLVFLLSAVVIKPMGTIGAPQSAYMNGELFTGFTAGYNTMDALASLVFGIIVIKAIRSMGVTSKKGILMATMKTGAVATFFLALLYAGIAYLGAVSTEKLGLLETGGQVLTRTATYYFGTLGFILLAAVMILACLTTAIGLMTACGEYFHQLFPKISYKAFVTFFTTFCFVVANVGLANIIVFSMPLLMFIYPLAISLMILAFCAPLFKDAKIIYIVTTITVFFISVIDGLKTLCTTLEIELFSWLHPIVTVYENYLPLYTDGLGWLLPFVMVLLVMTLFVRAFGTKTTA